MVIRCGDGGLESRFLGKRECNAIQYSDLVWFGSHTSADGTIMGLLLYHLTGQENHLRSAPGVQGLGHIPCKPWQTARFPAQGECPTQTVEATNPTMMHNRNHPREAELPRQEMTSWWDKSRIGGSGNGVPCSIHTREECKPTAQHNY